MSRTTVTEFANQICDRAKAFDTDILMEGLQAVSANPEDSCKVYCKSKNGKPITKSWIYPDGTTCRNTNSDIDDNYYCINGRCEVIVYIHIHTSRNIFRPERHYIFCSHRFFRNSHVRIVLQIIFCRTRLFVLVI